MAISMHRTLVLPPDMKYYLLWNNNDKTKTKKSLQSQSKRKGMTNNVMNFHDFFHLESIQNEYTNTLKIISMEEFLTRVGMTGQLRSRSHPNQAIRYPNRTDWSSESWALYNYQSKRNKIQKSDLLWEYVRDVTQPLLWDSDTCVAVFPSSSSSSSSVDTVATKDETTVDSDTQRQLEYLQKVLQNDPIQFSDHLQQLPSHRRRFVRWHQLRQNSYRNHPTPVNATATERLAEMLANRKQLCIYNQSIHQQYKVLHMTGTETSTIIGSSANGGIGSKPHEVTSNRFLIHFYAFLFYENYHTDLFIKRFIRDHLRYVPQCDTFTLSHSISRSSHVYSSLKHARLATFPDILMRSNVVPLELLKPYETLHDRMVTMLPNQVRTTSLWLDNMIAFISDVVTFNTI
jgi:hypothetical protein